MNRTHPHIQFGKDCLKYLNHRKVRKQEELIESLCLSIFGIALLFSVALFQ